MTPVLNEETGLMYETIDVNIIPDLYVTWIVDIWQGNRDDPAVDVTRWIGVWAADALEDAEGNAVDPSFKPGRWGEGAAPTIEALHWEELEHIKKADSAARTFKQQSDNMLDAEAYAYGDQRRRKTAYIAFMEAIDRLATDDTDEEAWTAVDRWRQLHAMEHEK